MSGGGCTDASDFVWIKLGSAPGDVFSKIFYSPGKDVSDVAALACKQFPRWRLDAGQVRIHLAAESGQEEPGDEAILAALDKKHLSVSAALASGAWLVVKHTRAPAPSFLPGRLSFGGGLDGGGGGGGSAGGSGSISGRASPTLPAARLPSVSEAAGPTFEHEARAVVSALFRELCPWASDHSPLLSRALDRGGNQREADVMCYVLGDTLLPCVALAGHGACLVELPGPDLPALPPMPLPAGRRFSPTDATRMGPHKYFLSEVYSGHRTEVQAEKVAQLETLCERLKIRWQDQQAEVVEGLPLVTDVTQVVGAAALIFSAGDGLRLEVLKKALARVSRSAAQCPNLARMAAAGRLLVIVLDKTQAPSTFFQRSVAAHLDRLRNIPEELAGVAAAVENLTAAVGKLGGAGLR